MDVPNPPFRTVTEELLYSIYLKLQGGGNMPGLLTKDNINTLAKLNAILEDSELVSAEQFAESIAALKGDVPVVANSLEKLYNIIQGITALKREDIDTIEELNAILTNADLVRIDDLAKALAALNLRRRSIHFYFTGDKWDDDHHHNNSRDTYVFRGKIDSLTEDLTDDLSSVNYKSRLDNSDGWASHSNLDSLQTWINRFTSGDDQTGTKYWIKCRAQYKAGRDGEAVNIFKFNTS